MPRARAGVAKVLWCDQTELNLADLVMTDLDFRIDLASEADMADWLHMRLRLWPDADAGILRQELTDILDEDNNGVAWIAWAEDGLPIAFAEADIREYSEGCDAPTPYLEGIWVAPNYRRVGVADSLLACVEEWARKKGFGELASDTMIDNPMGQSWHNAVGFEEVERIVIYRKDI